MEKARAYPDEKRAQGRRRPRASNLLAVFLVLTIGSLARWCCLVNCARGIGRGPPAPRRPEPTRRSFWSRASRRPHLEAMVGKAEGAAASAAGQARRHRPAASRSGGRGLCPAFIVLLIGRLRPAREPVEPHEKWASVPAETAAKPAPNARKHPATGTIAAKPHTALVSGDQVATPAGSRQKRIASAARPAPPDATASRRRISRRAGRGR